MKRTYYYLLTSGVILFVIALIARTILIPGYIHFRDVTEGANVSNLYQRYIYTYSNDIGESLAEKARVPLFFLIFGIYKTANFIGLGDEFYVKIKIFLLFISSFFAFTLIARKLIEKYLPPSQQLGKYAPAIVIPPVLGALFYTTNFWFTNRIAHFGLFFATVTVPIVFYLFFDYFFSEKKDLRKLILLSLVLGIFTATPHTVLFETLIFVSIFLAYLITRVGTKDNLFTPLWQLLVFLVTTALVNVYWILPYLVSNSKPDAEVSETIVKLIGRYATLENSLGLMGYWLTEPGSYYLSGITSIVAFIPLLLFGVAFIGLRIKKQHRLFLTLLIMFIFGAFLSTSETLTDMLYFKVMFDSPLQNFGWLFREYDKFGLILTFVYSLAIAILFRFAIRRTRIFLMVIFPFASIIFVNLLFLNKTLETNYLPVIIPDSYGKVTNIIKQDNSESNVLWYPGNPKPFWANGEEVRFTFSNLVSPKPSITTRSEIINYASYLFNLENVYSIDVGKALDLVGVKYLVIRKDDSVFKSGRTDDLLSTQNSIKKIYSDELLTLYENTAFTGVGRAYSSKIITNMGLEFLKQEVAAKYDNVNTFIDFSDRPSGLDVNNNFYVFGPDTFLDESLAKYSDRFIYPSMYSHKKEDGNPGFWKTGSLENVNHAEVDFFLNNLGLNIRQFDFGKGVVIARDGWQLTDGIFVKGTPIGIMFSGHQNVTLAGGNLHYSSVAKDFDYYWNTIRSDRFDVLGKTALGIRFNSNIHENLIPHFKFTFYGKENTILGIVPMYQDERGLMENIVKVPAGAETAVFSIWTISKEQDQSYSYSLSDFALKDLTNAAEPITLSFVADTECKNTCNVYVRALKSDIGGKIQVVINEKEFPIETKTPDLMKNNRYEWENIGRIEGINKNTKISLKNLEGFNSVNVILFLNDSEAIGTAMNVPATDKTLLVTSSPANLPFVQTTQINPAKYEIRVLKDLEGRSVLAFAKPYSKNWLLEPNGTEAKLVNGYINGWEMDNLKEGTYTVIYKPQKYFIYGSLISGVMGSLILIYLAVSYLRSFSTSDRRSNSQG